MTAPRPYTVTRHATNAAPDVCLLHAADEHGPERITCTWFIDAGNVVLDLTPYAARALVDRLTGVLAEHDAPVRIPVPDGHAEAFVNERLEAAHTDAAPDGWGGWIEP